MSSASQLKHHKKKTKSSNGSPTGVRLELLGAVKRGINAKELRLTQGRNSQIAGPLIKGGMAEEGRRKIRPDRAWTLPFEDE